MTKIERKLKNLKKFLIAKGNKSLINFLNIESDYVYIATESGNHFDHILKCFKHNKMLLLKNHLF